MEETKTDGTVGIGVYVVRPSEITDYKKGSVLYLKVREEGNKRPQGYDLVECSLASVIYQPRDEEGFTATVTADRGRKMWTVQDNGSLFDFIEDAHRHNEIQLDYVKPPEWVRAIDLYYQDRDGGCRCFVRAFDKDYDAIRTQRVPFHVSIDILTGAIFTSHDKPVFTSAEEYKKHYGTETEIYNEVKVSRDLTEE